LNGKWNGLTFSGMIDLGKALIALGVVLVIVGFLLWRVPDWFRWVGRLPGDFSIKKDSFGFYFPLATCLVISLVLTLLSWLFRR
jgi:hypothetical protein